MKNGWKNVVPDYVKENELRMQLLEAQARIVQLEWQVKKYRKLAFTPEEKSALSAGVLFHVDDVAQLEQEIAMLRGVFKGGPSPEMIASKVRHKMTAGMPSESEFARLRELTQSQHCEILKLREEIRNAKVKTDRPKLDEKSQQGNDLKKKRKAAYALVVMPTRRYIFEAFSATCFYCRCQLQEHAFTLDHQIPKSKGGSNSRKNYVAACGPCNTTKGDRMPTAGELERAAAIRHAYGTRPPNAEPIMPPAYVAETEKPSEQYRVRSVAQIEQEIEEKMRLDRELFPRTA